MSSVANKSASKDAVEKPAAAASANASAADDSKATKKSRSSQKKVVNNPANQGLSKRRHNIIVVRKSMLFKTLVIQTKNLLKNQFETIELHGVDDQSYLTVNLVANTLIKYKYVTITRLKTKTVQVHDDETDKYAKLQPRLIVHLKKTPEFDSIYDDFEAVFKKVAEEHEEDIAIAQTDLESEEKEGGELEDLEEEEDEADQKEVEEEKVCADSDKYKAKD